MDLFTQFRGRQCRDIGAVEVQRQVTSCCVVPDDQIPPEASQVLDALGRQLRLAYRSVSDHLLFLPIDIDINAIPFAQIKSDVEVVCGFIFETEA